MKCWIYDIDGTIADGDHRSHLITNPDKTRHPNPDWDAYFKACAGDKPIEHMRLLAHACATTHPVVYVSGRSDIVRTETIDWLRGLTFPLFNSPQGLYMRPAGDHRDDDVLKWELYQQALKDGWKPIMVFDDRARVVKMWRAHGVPCAQVADGDF